MDACVLASIYGMSTGCHEGRIDSWTGTHKLSWRVDQLLMENEGSGQDIYVEPYISKEPLLTIWLTHQLWIFGNFL